MTYYSKYQYTKGIRAKPSDLYEFVSQQIANLIKTLQVLQGGYVNVNDIIQNTYTTISILKDAIAAIMFLFCN